MFLRHVVYLFPTFRRNRGLHYEDDNLVQNPFSVTSRDVGSIFRLKGGDLSV